MLSRLLSVSLLAVIPVVFGAPPTLAATGDASVFTATLTPQNDTGAIGFAVFVLDAESTPVGAAPLAWSGWTFLPSAEPWSPPQSRLPGSPSGGDQSRRGETLAC